MDLFTHVMFAYFLSFVIWGPANPQYIAAGALAGGLPDADILLFPLARRFEVFEHHGITHSLVGVTVIAGAGSFLLPYLPYFPHASTLLYFVAMEIGGLTHVLLDGFTHFAVHPILPFSWKELRMDADVAINVVMLSITTASLVILVWERGRVPFNIWVETAWILTLVYLSYLLIRGAARWRAGVLRKKEGYSGVAPSTLPWVWTLMDQQDGPTHYAVRYRQYRWGESGKDNERRLEVRKLLDAPPGPVLTAQDALDRTYVPAMAKNRWLEFRPHYGEAIPRGEVYDVYWYMVEGAGSGRRLGVRGFIDRATGEFQLKSGFFRLPRREPLP